MNRRRVAATLSAAAALSFLSACSNSATEAPATSPAASATSAAPNPVVDDQPHNGADVEFAQAMIPHHQQAVEMSDMLLAKQDIDPRVVSLAREIKAAQGPEITQMQGWLQAWGLPTMSSPDSMPGHEMPGDAMMPGMSHGEGMMSQQDMAALQYAQGAEASRLFLTQMIEHHEGAVQMATREMDEGQYAPAVNLARLIDSLQRQEIATMRKVLDSL